MLCTATSCADPADSASPSGATDPSTSTAAPGNTAHLDTTSSTSSTIPAITTTAGDVDLSRSPALVEGDQATAHFFEHAADPPTVTVGPLTRPDLFVFSPDSRYAAVTHAGDAVRKARVELVETDTGRAVETVEVDADQSEVRYWSPDSAAVLVGGRSGTGTYTWGSYGVDGSTQTLTSNFVSTMPYWGRGASQTKVVDCSTCSRVLQLMTSKGVPVSVAGTRQPSDGGIQAGRYDVDTGAIIRFDGELGSQGLYGEACGRFATINGRSASPGGAPIYALYDSDSGRVIPSVAPKGCPVVSNDGTRAALGLADGSTSVYDLATGTPVQVARQGVPVAWSKDDSKLVVNGNGTFVVASDGSGGKAASITITTFCSIGATGTLLAVDSTSPGGAALVHYDIATDSAKSLGKGQLNAACEVSRDGDWLVSDRTLVDLASGRSATLTVRVTAGDRTTDGGDVHFRDPESISPNMTSR